MQHIQHYIIQHKVHTARLFNMLIQKANKIKELKKNGTEKVKEIQCKLQHIIIQHYKKAQKQTSWENTT